MDQLLSKSDLTTDGSLKPTVGARKPTQAKVKTECVRVTCRDCEADFEETNKGEEGDEDGQMIWWSWNGKLEGFSDF